jgi:hypothetical protein
VKYWAAWSKTSGAPAAAALGSAPGSEPSCAARVPRRPPTPCSPATQSGKTISVSATPCMPQSAYAGADAAGQATSPWLLTQDGSVTPAGSSCLSVPTHPPVSKTTERTFLAASSMESTRPDRPPPMMATSGSPENGALNDTCSRRCGCSRRCSRLRSTRDAKQENQLYRAMRKTIIKAPTAVLHPTAWRRCLSALAPPTESPHIAQQCSLP